MSDKTAEYVINRRNDLKSKRSNWDIAWQRVSDMCIPRKGNITIKKESGQDQTTQIYDSTAEESGLIAAAGLLSQIVPPGEPWFAYDASNPEASAQTKKKFEVATDRARKRIYESNFYLGIHEDFLDAVHFGTSNTYIEEGKKKLLNFVNKPLGTFSIDVDNEGMVDTVYSEWEWSAKQIEQNWPEKKDWPKEIAECLANADPSAWAKKFKIIHAVEPRRRNQVKEGLADGKSRPYASVYVCEECKAVLEESGFYENPFACSRLLISNNEIYGRGPGIQVMPEILMLNRMERDILLEVEMGVNPPWLMPEDTAYRPDNRPGGITYWDATTLNKDTKPERLQSQSRVDWGETKTEQKRNRIRSAYFVDMFQMLNAPGVREKEMTAREVAERIREKLVLFAPIFARLVQEKLNPMLERVFNIMLRAGEFDDLGFTAEDGGYEIAYTSKIALALKAANDSALIELVDVAALLQPFDQSIPYVIKWREAYRKMAVNRGMSSSDLRENEEIDQMIAQMQQAAAAQQAAAMGETVSKSVANLGPDAQKAATAAVKQTASRSI